jgi:hypothetical protein
LGLPLVPAKGGTQGQKRKNWIPAGAGARASRRLDTSTGMSGRELRTRSYGSIWVSPQIEIAWPEMVRPRSLQMNTI